MQLDTVVEATKPFMEIKQMCMAVYGASSYIFPRSHCPAPSSATAWWLCASHLVSLCLCFFMCKRNGWTRSPPMPPRMCGSEPPLCPPRQQSSWTTAICVAVSHSAWRLRGQGLLVLLPSTVPGHDTHLPLKVLMKELAQLNANAPNPSIDLAVSRNATGLADGSPWLEFPHSVFSLIGQGGWFVPPWCELENLLATYKSSCWKPTHWKHGF